jgi:hypothetical protein
LPFTENMSEVWDNFCSFSEVATFLQTRSFLSYHLDRFVDASLLLMDDSDTLIGVFPAGVSPGDNSLIVSHPGSTYGGLVHKGRVSVTDIADMLDAIINWYKEHGFGRLLYKVTPPHVQKTNSAIDQYLLWQRGRLVRRDLWNVIHLDAQRSLSKGRKWGVNRGRKAGLQVAPTQSPEAYREFYEILASNLKDKHGTVPVHSFDELIELSKRFPLETALYLARDSDGTLCAGVWLFKLNPFCVHTQYIASTESGRELAAVDYLIESIIQASAEEGARWFSFGASTENGGQNINDGLFAFKAGFGIGSMTQDFFEIELA